MKKALMIMAVLAMAFTGCYKDGKSGNEGDPTTGTLNGHEWVDLGLPSGTLWATCNVGASTPTDYGACFAWGETEPQADNAYSWSSYKYCNGDYNKLTKYCNKASYGDNGFTDNLTTLEASDDAATANWGAGWRMPTNAEMEELYNNTIVTWTRQNGVNGRIFTASNGNSIFLPAAGYHWDDIFDGTGSFGYYWLSSLDTGAPYRACRFYFVSDYYYVSGSIRNGGFSVRPVCPAQN